MLRSALVASLLLGFLFLVAQPKAVDPAPKGNQPKSDVTVFRVGAGKKYHLEDCPVCNPKGVFVGNALTMEEAAKAGLTPCAKCNPPDRKPTTTTGKVILVRDGDTLVLDDGTTKHDVRLEGIDALEHNQAFGKEATKGLEAKVSGKQVNVIWVAKDRDGRLLGHVHLGERWINEEMIAEGFAWHFAKYNADPRLAAAEKATRAAKKGLWADEKAIPPWKFRKDK